jgi:acyl-CoA dehydrogenase
MDFPTTRWTQIADELGATFAQRGARHDESDTFVSENYVDLKARKLIAAAVPEELGGGGATAADMAGFLRTLAHHCSSTALAFSMHTHLVATAAWRWRNQKAPLEPLLRRVANEEIILVSTGGADWIQGSCEATKVESGYRVSGRKIFCSGAPAGSLMMTTAVYADPAEGPTVLQIAVPMGADGVKIQDNWRTIGMRATGSHDIVLEGVFVPDSAVALKRKSGKWHPLIDTITLVALPLILVVYVGVAEAAREIAIDMARKKRDDRNVQALAGEMDNELTTAQLAIARMIEMTMTLQPAPAVSAEVMRCRSIVGRSARAAVDKAMELAGGSSFYRVNKLEKLLRDIQGVRFHPLQDKPQAVLAGRHAFGLPFDD